MIGARRQQAVREPDPASTAQATSGRFVLLESAVRAGQATSARVIREFGTADPWRLIELLGVELELRGRCPDNPRLRSEAITDPPTIVLYSEALADLARLLALRAPRLAGVAIDTVAVAVELYRFMERGRPDLLHRVTSSWPRVAREVAAHAFAQDLLELPFFPAEIDAVERVARAPLPVGVRRT
jgi:hypothetical protein